ncbi:GAF and ANTAR domain-containing protein [Haloactinopolyspora sp.]|uniref:GAF and ANTAR domain-containing protein n=1 Tax=Haloactinopolyspora sp. TaxID=1966353 RepID=UPI0026074C68|nr:GAF and ANTAR domain-containing protein [Haloactinopolyspora sp.]
MNTLDQRVRDTFVDLADTLVDDYDVIEFVEGLATRVVDLLEIGASGLVLADHHGSLNLVAASSERTRALQLLQVHNAEGPCIDCYRSGSVVSCDDLSTADERWPRFARAARSAGFASVHALPMRLRDTVIGTLNMFGRRSEHLDSGKLELGQALADVATIGILHERTLRQHETVAEQLQAALNSRILIEQAKGILAERHRVSVADAFTALRAHARHHQRKLHDVAGNVVDGSLDVPAEPRPASGAVPPARRHGDSSRR